MGTARAVFVVNDLPGPGFRGSFLSHPAGGRDRCLAARLLGSCAFATRLAPSAKELRVKRLGHGLPQLGPSLVPPGARLLLWIGFRSSPKNQR